MGVIFDIDKGAIDTRDLVKASSSVVPVQRVEVRSRHSWAVLQWSDDGRVVLHSDHGTWGAWFGEAQRGTRTMRAYLASLDHDSGARRFDVPMVFDEEGTDRECRKLLLETRRRGELTREQAREEWDAIASGDIIEFNDWLRETLLEFAWECETSCRDPAWTNMWRSLWEPGIGPELERLDDPRRVEA